MQKDRPRTGGEKTLRQRKSGTRLKRKKRVMFGKAKGNFMDELLGRGRCQEGGGEALTEAGRPRPPRQREKGRKATSSRTGHQSGVG